MKLKTETSLWLSQASGHWKDANWLLEGRRYSACVYSCHQTLEKALKGAIVEKKEKIPSKGHQLQDLAIEAGLSLPEGWGEELSKITRDFWRVRYPDFRRVVYTSKQKILPIFETTEEIYIWLQKELSKKN